MPWKDLQSEIENCEVIIWFDTNDTLYPMSEWLHLGLIPVGNGHKEGLIYDLPNLEWMIRHLAWLGFRNITIYSANPLKGLNVALRKVDSRINLTFYEDFWFTGLPKDKIPVKSDLIIISGSHITNADFRNGLLLHRQRKNEASILALRGLRYTVGLVNVKNDEFNSVQVFREKPLDTSILINSGAIILSSELISHSNFTANVERLLNEIKDEDLIKNFNGINQNISVSQSIKSQLLDVLISKEQLSAIELTGVSGEPWFIDLSSIETWVKMDFNDFIERFNHLYKLN